jgi:hypothetical protein
LEDDSCLPSSDRKYACYISVLGIDHFCTKSSSLIILFLLLLKLLLKMCPGEGLFYYQVKRQILTNSLTVWTFGPRMLNKRLSCDVLICLTREEVFLVCRSFQFESTVLTSLLDGADNGHHYSGAWSE